MLRMAGHGDVISIVDCNFPAAEVASNTFYGKVRELRPPPCLPWAHQR